MKLRVGDVYTIFPFDEPVRIVNDGGDATVESFPLPAGQLYTFTAENAKLSIIAEDGSTASEVWITVVR